MKKLWIVAAVCAAATIVPSCRMREPAGSISAQGYQHKVYDYGLAPLPDGSLMPSGWQLDNFFTQRTRVQRELGSSPTWQLVLTPKDGPDYKTEYLLDLTGNGDFDVTEDAFLYDLRFTHSVHAGVVWLMTVPIPVRWQNKNLGVLTREYVDSISGSGFEVVEYKAIRVETIEKTYASSILETAVGTVAGREAYAATVDVANIDQLRLDPKHRYRRARVVLVRSGLVYAYSRLGKKYSFPVILFLGYSNRPEDFDAGLTDFEGFVNRVAVGRQIGAVLRSARAAPAPAPPGDAALPPEAKTASTPASATPPPAASGAAPPAASGVASPAASGAAPP